MKKNHELEAEQVRKIIKLLFQGLVLIMFIITFASFIEMVRDNNDKEERVYEVCVNACSETDASGGNIITERTACVTSCNLLYDQITRTEYINKQTQR